MAVFLLSGMGKNTELVGDLFISEKINDGLSEFLSGQIWRVFTPIFLHFHNFHILFNMYWLHNLGSQIEKIKGAKFFISFVLIIALVSNLTQFFFNGPAFGGMSGVVYGLFGYVWIKTRLDPADGFQLDPTIAIIMFGFSHLFHWSNGRYSQLGSCRWTRSWISMGVWLCISMESRKKVIYYISSLMIS